MCSRSLYVLSKQAKSHKLAESKCGEHFSVRVVISLGVGAVQKKRESFAHQTKSPWFCDCTAGLQAETSQALASLWESLQTVSVQPGTVCKLVLHNGSLQCIKLMDLSKKMKQQKKTTRFMFITWKKMFKCGFAKRISHQKTWHYIHGCFFDESGLDSSKLATKPRVFFVMNPALIHHNLKISSYIVSRANDIIDLNQMI